MEYMDYKQMVLKRWFNQPRFIEVADHPVAWEAYWFTRLGSKGCISPAKTEVLKTLRMIAEARGWSDEQYNVVAKRMDLKYSSARSREKAKEKEVELRTKYYPVVHCLDGRKISGPYTSMHQAMKMRRQMVRKAITNNTSPAFETAWYNKQIGKHLDD